MFLLINSREPTDSLSEPRENLWIESASQILYFTDPKWEGSCEESKHHGVKLCKHEI